MQPQWEAVSGERSLSEASDAEAGWEEETLTASECLQTEGKVEPEKVETLRAQGTAASRHQKGRSEGKEQEQGGALKVSLQQHLQGVHPQGPPPTLTNNTQAP